MWEHYELDTWAHTVWTVNTIGGMFSGKVPDLPPFLRLIAQKDTIHRPNLTRISPEDQKILLKSFVKEKKYGKA